MRGVPPIFLALDTLMHIYLLAVISTVLTVVSGTIVFDAEGYSDHHNFGYLFQKTQGVYLSSGKAKVILHYRLLSI